MMCQIEAVLPIFDWIKTCSIMSCIFGIDALDEWRWLWFAIETWRAKNFVINSMADNTIAYDVNFTFF